mgnify:CR=1 FL=1
MAFVKSRYTFDCETDDGNILLYNSFKGLQSLAMISRDDYHTLLEGLSCESVDKESSALNKMMDLGHIVSEKLNEESFCSLKIMEQVERPVLCLIIMPTEQCNFRCRYCYENFQKPKMSSQVQNDIISYVRKNINRYTALEVRWFGGEPLEALDVVDNLSRHFMHICSAAKKTYRAGITTNGYNLTLNVFEMLYSLHVFDYQITIDGLKDEHDRLRILKNGTGTFDRIVHNLQTIKREARAPFCPFTIRTNFNKQSAAKIQEYLAFVSQTFDDSRFCFSVERAADWGGESVKSISDILMDKDDYRKLLQTIENADIQLNLNYS